MILVLGIDAATWTVVYPNLDRLPFFARLCRTGKGSDMVLEETPISPSVWCSMFCGKLPEEHQHGSFVTGGKLVRRQDIAVDFIWDILDREGRKVKVLNVPFVVPPYSFGVDFRPVGFGLPTNDREWQQELERVSQKTKQLMAGTPDVLIACYTLLDRVQHFHWGEPCVLDWYRKMDARMGELVFDNGFLDSKDNRLIVISDHGFCSFGESKVQTLPMKSDEGQLKGDHHENALVITVNLDYDIKAPQDVFRAIRREYGQSR
jgi:predicted AlkP superfamily phosphohydrolase/phosphomutase